MFNPKFGILTFPATNLPVLCIGAAYVVIAYPIVKLAGVDRLGGPAFIITAIVTLCLFWWLSSRRGASHFGMLAAALGLISPIGATAYANWLISMPARSYPAARDFEPLRMLVVLWLVSLAIGLIVRFVAAMNRKNLSRLGEFAWIALASIVGGLALVSTTQDPNAVWPFAELSSLALIIVLSSVASAQAWRGHVAAFTAAAGMSTWLFHHTGKDEIQLLWNILWGPTWVALVAIAAKLLVERTRASKGLLPIRLVAVVSCCQSFHWQVCGGSIPREPNGYGAIGGGIRSYCCLPRCYTEFRVGCAIRSGSAL